MRKFVVAVILLAGCSTPAAPPPAGVQPEVVERINAATDCAVLQGEFDTAMARVDSFEPNTPHRDLALHYAKLAVARMEAIGCP
jgi:hypothetical protein